MIEKNKTKQNKQAKDKRGTEKTVGPVSGNYKKKVPKQVLYVPEECPFWFKLAHRTLMAESKFGGILEIRFEGTSTTVLQLQYQPWRERSGLLYHNVIGNRPRSNGQTPKRQAGKRKGSGSLPKPHPKLPRTFGKLKGE